MDLKITLQPKQREALQKSETTPVLFYGGAKGGGKSYLVRAREVKRRLLYRGTKGLIVRKTFPELLANHIRPFFKEYPETRNWYNKAEKTIYWPNGSTTEFSYLGNTDDVYTYQGREYDDEAIDEVTQHEWEVVRILRTSLRTANPQISPTMLLTGNPGGVGHQEVKRIFIDKQFRQEENPEDFAFVQAFVDDNLALMEADPAYKKRLQDLPEHLRKAYLEGDWNIHAGQAFSELSSRIHLIDPFELPPSTRWVASFDPGFNHPFSFVLAGVVPDGTVYITQHYTGRLKQTSEIVDGIDKNLRGRDCDIYAGHDLWYPGRGGGMAEVETYRELLSQKGYRETNIIKAKTDRKAGVSAIRKYITLKNDAKKPMVYFFRNEPVVDLFNTVSSMQFDARDPEDVLKVDADENGIGGDDSYDSFRYLIMSRVSPADKQVHKVVQFTGQDVLNQLMEGQDDVYNW